MNRFETIKKFSGIAIVLIIVAAFVTVGCDNLLGEDDDDDETTGTLTVTLSGAEAQNGQTLLAGVWEEGIHPADSPPIEGTAKTDTIASGTATVTIPPWDGMKVGARYDVFILIYIDHTDGEPQPGIDYVYKSTSAIPWTVDGDRTIDTAYGDYIVIPTE